MDMEAEIIELKRQIAGIPSRWAGGVTAAAYKTICIIGGNTALIGGGVEGIQYVSELADLTQEYDPNTDTVYPAGLGRGVLFIDGVRQAGYVLVRHDFYGNSLPVLAGMLVRVAGSVTVSYDPGGGDPVVNMSAYTFDWV